jgi:hypothetical protein
MTTLLVGTKSQQSLSNIATAEVLVRRDVLRRSEVVDAGGEATITLPGLETASWKRYYIYESIKIFSDSISVSRLTMYEGEILPQFFLGGTDRGNLNEWTENPPLYTDSPVHFQWTGADTGALCFLRAQISEVIMIPVNV